MWTYTNPPLSEGPVISGYRVYVDGQRMGGTAETQFNIAPLLPFTDYTVEVSAYNTRGDGVEQEGSRSDSVSERTLEDGWCCPIGLTAK